MFKKRAPGDAYYDLPPRYQNGGADYNGDLNDYYHIGTVYSVNPLKIIHMTDPSAKVDDKIGKWSCAGIPSRSSRGGRYRHGWNR